MGCSHCSLSLGHMGVLKMHMCATQQIDARKKKKKLSRGVDSSRWVYLQWELFILSVCLKRKDK